MILKVQADTVEEMINYLGIISKHLLEGKRKGKEQQVIWTLEENDEVMEFASKISG